MTLGGDPNNPSVVYWSSSSPNVYSLFGSAVKSVSLNLHNNTIPFFVYSRNYDNSWSNWLGDGSTIQQINTNGKDVNLSNGVPYKPNQYAPYLKFMFVESFVSTSLPYFFQTSNAVEGYFPKSSPATTTSGRGLCLDKRDLHFYYSFGGLLVDGQSVGFVEADDWRDYGKLDTTNSVLVTEPFNVTKGSKFLFDEESGFTDSLGASCVLGDSGYVNCKVELVDNETGISIGTLKRVCMSAHSTPRYALISYEVDMSKIKPKKVKARVSIATNLDSIKVALVKSYDEVEVVDNPSVNRASLQILGIIADYVLNQNYPNPFNPTTEISYEIPKSGLVILKAYDVLGREVRTLVNEFQQEGRYSVILNAAGLSSGVYFYRLVSGNYVSTKKMLLMK